MINLYPLNWTSYLSVLLIFFRLLGLFLFMPGFSHRAIPAPVKLLLSLAVSLALFPMLSPYLPAIPMNIGGIVLSVIRESSIGLLMGFIAYVTFEGIHLAAQAVGYQLGFGTVGIIDPVNQGNVSPLVPLFRWVAIALFFVTDMHHYLLQLFVNSFHVTQSVGIQLLSNTSLLRVLIGTTAKMFVIAVKIGAPFILLVLASQAAVGILARMLPQMHVILFAFPVTILLGLLTFYFIAPEFLFFIENLFSDMWADTAALLKVL